MLAPEEGWITYDEPTCHKLASQVPGGEENKECGSCAINSALLQLNRA